MSIKKRGNVWHVDVTVGGQRVQQSAGTTSREQAQELHDKIKADLWRQEKLGEARRFAWHEAVKLYLSERQHLRQLDRVISPQIVWLTERIGDNAALVDIGSDVIVRLRLARAGMLVRGKKPKQATLNYPLSILQSILNLAHKHGMLAAVPHIEMPPPRNERTRWITRQEADGLLGKTSGVLHDAIEFSLETGLRQENVISLRWEWIDIVNRSITIPAHSFKTKKAHTLPVSDRAHELLLAQRNRSSEYVFVEDTRKRICEPNDKLKAACALVSITDFHWHDLRHTWATWHVRAGTPLEVLQKLGGWSSYRMVLRYAVFAQDHLATYANQLKRDIRVTPDNNVTPIRHIA